MRYTRKRKQRGGNIDHLKASMSELNAALKRVEALPDNDTKQGIIKQLKISMVMVLRKLNELKKIESARSASRVPPPPPRSSASRRSPSRRSVPRQSKSLFSCLPGMSCSNAKGIRKKRRRRRRTRRKR